MKQNNNALSSFQNSRGQIISGMMRVGIGAITLLFLPAYNPSTIFLPAAVLTGMLFILWGCVSVALPQKWGTPFQRAQIIVFVDLILTVSVVVIFARLPTSSAPAAFLLLAYEFTELFLLMGVITVIVAFCWTEIFIAILQLSFISNRLWWFYTFLWFILIVLTGVLHLIRIRLTSSLETTTSANLEGETVSNIIYPNQLHTGQQQIVESTLTQQGNKSASVFEINQNTDIALSEASLLMSSTPTFIIESAPAHMQRQQAMVQAIEAAFERAGVNVSGHHAEIAQAVNSLFCPQTQDTSALSGCLEQLLHELEENWREQSTLSAREREIVELLAQGLSYREIGDKLCLSKSTVKTHVGHIFQKLNVANREDVVRIARERGWVKREAEETTIRS